MTKIFSTLLFTLLVGCANINPSYNVVWKHYPTSDHPIVIVGVDIEKLNGQRTFEIYFDEKSLKHYGVYVNGSWNVFTQTHDGYVRIFTDKDNLEDARINIHFIDLNEDPNKVMDAIYRVVHRKMTQEELEYESESVEFKL